ncbi:MAG TPA: ABC transporter substrate-binding protein [Bdellovibrionota bacterium]|nr:ABC transporter substrate-binding protein [Bdellovibrionota bacterium]
MKFARFLIPALLLSLALAACSKSGGGKTLHVYTSLDSDEAPVYLKKFEEKTGIKVNWVRLSAGEALARLEAEKGNPQVSVWFGGSESEYIAATRRGLLEPYQPKVDFELAANQRDPNWNWVGFYFGAIGFASNENFFKEKGLKIPQTWEDLLDPALKGKISMAFPYTSGTAYTVVAALLQKYGEEKGWEYIRKLDRQIHHYNKSGSAAVTQVGLGEVAVGISFSHDILKKGKKSGYPVALSVPKDGTASEIGAVALVKGGREPELARRFIDEILTAEAQNELQQFSRVPLNPKSMIAEGAVRAAEVKLIAYDPTKAAETQKEILEKWRKVTAR